jgi:hypothetical protein
MNLLNYFMTAFLNKTSCKRKKYCDKREIICQHCGSSKEHYYWENNKECVTSVSRYKSNQSLRINTITHDRQFSVQYWFSAILTRKVYRTLSINNPVCILHHKLLIILS